MRQEGIAISYYYRSFVWTAVQYLQAAAGSLVIPVVLISLAEEVYCTTMEQPSSLKRFIFALMTGARRLPIVEVLSKKHLHNPPTITTMVVIVQLKTPAVLTRK